MEILRAWLSGEQTLPEAVRDWADDRSGRELAWRTLYVVLQTVVGSVVLAGAVRGLTAIAGFLDATPTATVLELAALWLIAAELLHLSLTARSVAMRSVRGGGSAPGTAGSKDGADPKTHTSGDRKDGGDGEMAAEGGLRG